MKTPFILLPAATFLLAGCIDNASNPEIKTEYVAVIVNNGTDHNGSVYYYYENDKVVIKDPLENKQSATYRSVQVLNESLCVVTNADDAVLTYNIVGRLLRPPFSDADNLGTPRFMAADQNYLYISNWGEETAGTYNNSYITVLDRWDYSLRKKLPCASKAEGVLVHSNRLFVATAAGVEVFSTLNDLVRESIITAPTLTGNAKHFVADDSEHVWVSYDGGGLLCFDPASRAVLRELPNVPVDAETGVIAVTKDRKKIISYTNTPAATVTATDIATGAQTGLIEGNYTITALGVSPFTGDIFVAHTAPDGRSTLMVFDETGAKLHETEAGLHTGHITFFGYYYN